jgi:hypothetical protein
MISGAAPWSDGWPQKGQTRSPKVATPVDLLCAVERAQGGIQATLCLDTDHGFDDLLSSSFKEGCWRITSNPENPIN